MLSTLAYLGCSRCCAGPLGAQVANLVALLLTAVANTAANRRLTFGVTRPAARSAGTRPRGWWCSGSGWALTAGALALVPAGSRGLQLAVLMVANATATLLRFVLMRGWIFRRP